MRPNRWRLVAVMCSFVTAALVATWPLPLRATHAVVGDLGDPIFGATILGWDANRILHGFRGFWDAPFLFPVPHALTHAEHLLGIAMFVAPVEWWSRNPILAYNTAYFFTYVLAGVGMFLLNRSLWRRWDAALLAALAFELTQYRAEQASHIQVLANGWMPVALWGLHRYFQTGLRRWAALFGAGYLLTGLSNGYYFYFFLIPPGVLVAFELVHPRLPRSRMLVDLMAVTAAVAVAVAPIVLAYARLRSGGGFARGEGELDLFGATLADYVHVTPGAWSWFGSLTPGPAERNLFPGFITLAFAAVGVLRVRTREVAAYGVIAAAAIWLSMGAHGGPVYGWLFRVVPGFDGLRVPARLAAVALVGLTVLAGAGFARVLARLGPATRVLLLTSAAATILLEGPHGLRIVEVPSAHARSWDRVAYEWLASSPPGAVLELDINRSIDFRPETSTMYQLETLRHGHPIVNGYSGWGSALQDFLGDGNSPLRDTGSASAMLKGLRSIGVRYILLHDRTFTDVAEAAAIAGRIRGSAEQIVEEHRFEGTWAWRLADVVPPREIATGHEVLVPRAALTLAASTHPERVRLAIDGDIDTRWLSGEPQQGNEWLEIRFARPTDVARIELANAPRSTVDYPRHLVMESTEADGNVRTLFDASIVDQVIAATAKEDPRGAVQLVLPANRSMVLRLRQTGKARPWWSVHELSVWERATVN